MEKMTKREKKLNKRKNVVYSSFYSTVSFLVTLVYLVADIFVGDLWAAIIAAVLLTVSIITCEVGIKRLRTALERNDPKAKKWQERLSQIAEKVSYLSYPLLAGTLLWAIITNLQNLLH